MKRTEVAVVATLEQHLPEMVDNALGKSPLRRPPPFRRSGTSQPGDDDGSNDKPLTPSRRRGPKSTMVNSFNVRTLFLK